MLEKVVRTIKKLRKPKNENQLKLGKPLGSIRDLSHDDKVVALAKIVEMFGLYEDKS